MKLNIQNVRLKINIKAFIKNQGHSSKRAQVSGILMDLDRSKDHPLLA